MLFDLKITATTHDGEKLEYEFGETIRLKKGRDKKTYLDIQRNLINIVARKKAISKILEQLLSKALQKEGE